MEPVVNRAANDRPFPTDRVIDVRIFHSVRFCSIGAFQCPVNGEK